jgi:hypothetical protein
VSISSAGFSHFQLTALLAYNYPLDEHTNYQRKTEVKNHVGRLMNQWLRAIKHHDGGKNYFLLHVFNNFRLFGIFISCLEN